MNKLVKVNGYSRAKIRGTLIYCPHCKNPTRVYHFGWSGQDCDICLKTANKTEWLIESKK